jgi:hypothetical protein
MEVWVRGWMDQMVNENQTDLIGQSRISNVCDWFIKKIKHIWLVNEDNDVVHLQPGCLMKVRGTNAFSHNVPVIPTGTQCHMMLNHDVFELTTNLANLPYCLHMNEMFRTPLAGITVKNTILDSETMKCIYKRIQD